MPPRRRQVGGGQAPQTTLLGGVHRLLRKTEARPAPRLDLDDDHGVAVERHDVDLAQLAAPVDRQDCVSQRTQMCQCRRLAGVTQPQSQRARRRRRTFRRRCCPRPQPQRLPRAQRLRC